MILLLLFAATAHAETTIQPRDKAIDVYAEISPQAQDSKMECGKDECTITYIPKPGASVVFRDVRAIRAALLAELRELEALDDAGPISVAQAKRMRKLMLLLGGLSREQ